MDAIVAQIQNLAQTADEAGRLNIIKALRDVQTQLHSPKDTLMEIVASVCDDIFTLALLHVADECRV